MENSSGKYFLFLAATLFPWDLLTRTSLNLNYPLITTQIVTSSGTVNGKYRSSVTKSSNIEDVFFKCRDGHSICTNWFQKIHYTIKYNDDLSNSEPFWVFCCQVTSIWRRKLLSSTLQTAPVYWEDGDQSVNNHLWFLCCDTKNKSHCI